jgi:hypothetical protein
MAALALIEANAVRDFETETLGWREPPNDGDGRTDIYLKELGEHGLFGFAGADPGQSTKAQHAYLVVDNDFDPAQYDGVAALESLRVTLAHEYAHVLQYGYDVLADSWHFESSAVWMEQQVYPEITDWLRYVEDRPSGPGWSSLTEVPLTYYEPNPDSEDALDPRTAKPYGDVVFNHFLSAKYAPDGGALQVGTWERSRGIRAPSTDAFDAAIRAAGGQGLAPEFANFAAAVAEWRVADAPFTLPARLPDVERRGVLEHDGATARLMLDHLTFALYDVPETSAPIRLAATFPEGMSGAVALVAREGGTDTGAVTIALLERPRGGVGGVTLDDPARFYESGGRVTAVLVNADSSQLGWDQRVQDWSWLRDDQLVSAAVSSDTSDPQAALRRFRLRSRDTDRLSFVAELRQDGRVVGRRRGRVAPGDARRLSMAGGERGRAQLSVRLTDPSANTTRLTRNLRLTG